MVEMGDCFSKASVQGGWVRGLGRSRALRALSLQGLGFRVAGILSHDIYFYLRMLR